MNEHPILFSGEMVRAILDGRKTQTRRVIKPQPEPSQGWLYKGGYYHTQALTEYLESHCPYGKAGDRLWVRETFTSFSYRHVKDHDRVYPFHQHYAHYHGSITIYRADGSDFPKHFYEDGYARWKPAIHMHRYESRLTLEVVTVRVERVQDITDDDALCEGVDRTNTSIVGYARERFKTLWNSINEKRGFGWDNNPWVWVIEFKGV